MSRIIGPGAVGEDETVGSSGADDFTAQQQTYLSGTYVPAVMLAGVGVDTTGASDSTSALNAILSTVSAGMTAKGIRGASYRITAPLVVKSRTTLDMTGCTITLADGSNCNMLQNTAVNTIQRTITDLTTTAGSATVGSAGGFTSSDVGRTLVITAGNGSGFVAVGTVLSQAGSTAILSTAPLATLASGTAGVYSRDSAITVLGGTWNHGTNGSATNGYDKHAIRFRRVDGISVTGVTLSQTVGKYAVNLGDVTNFAVRDITLSSYSSDGVHVNGPASSGSISEIYGSGGDDLVALIGNDWAGYNDVIGDITDVSVTRVYANSNTSHVKMASGTGSKLRRITVENIYGTAGSYSVALLNVDDPAGHMPTDADDIVLRDLRAAVTSGPMVHVQANAVGTLTIDGAEFPKGTTTGRQIVAVAKESGVGATSPNIARLVVSRAVSSPIDQYHLVAVGGNGGATVTSLALDRCLMTPSNGSASQAGLVGTANAGTITDATVTDCRVVGTGGTWGTGVYVLDATTSIGHIRFTGCSFDGCRSAVEILASGSSLVAHFVNTRFKASSRMGNITGALDVTLSGCTGDTLGNAAWIASGGTGSVTVRGSGINRIGSWTGLQRSASEILRCINPDFPADISILAKNDGDSCVNTNSGVNPGAVPTVCDGTSWRSRSTGSVKTGTATLTAGTVTVSDTTITANSVIRVANKTAGGVVGAAYVSARSAGTSFTIASTNAADTSVIQYDVLAY